MSSDAPTEHRAYAPDVLGCVVLTVSDSRTLADDTSGELIAAQLEAAGRADVDAVLVSGGTGAAARDRSVETIAPLLAKELPGFGELFRALSFEEIGPAAMLSRALAGTIARKAVFLMPGSRAAVGLALERLILPELPHLIGQLRR